ncbi:MAG: hypothetical protein V1750_07040, partial [Acidobacteriota bacterium]
AAVRAELERQEAALGATITEVLPARTTIHPGQELTIEVRLQPQRALSVRQTLRIQVPASLAPGPVDLIVADGAAWSEYRIKTEAISPASFSDQLAQLSALESSAILIAALETRERGVAGPGVSQPALPPSWAATLAAGLGPRALTRLAAATLTTTRWSAPYPLEGAFRIPLTVQPILLEGK